MTISPDIGNYTADTRVK